MWRRSNANLDLFVARRGTDIPLFIAHSGVPFKPCFYFVRSRVSDCRTTSARAIGAIAIMLSFFVLSMIPAQMRSAFVTLKAKPVSTPAIQVRGMLFRIMLSW